MDIAHHNAAHAKLKSFQFSGTQHNVLNRKKETPQQGAMGAGCCGHISASSEMKSAQHRLNLNA